MKTEHLVSNLAGKPFTHWVYVITGHLQNSGTRTRLIDLWCRLHTAHCGPGKGVMLRSWNSDWKAEAEFMFRLSDSNPRISVVGFSWGAGWGVMQLAKQLERRGLSIHHACLIDPVYRHPYLLGQWRAFVPWIPIMVPRNVKRVTWWRQVMNWPRGHELVGLNEKTRIEQPFYVPATHSNMDDQPRILDECYHICQTELTT